MTIIVDTRQKSQKHNLKHADMERLGAQLMRSKLPIGDYALLTDMSTVIDTKQDLQEVYSNVISDHVRFIAEVKRAQDNGIKLVFLVEHGENIDCIEKVAEWGNPRALKWVVVDGKRKCIKTKCVPSVQLMKAMQTISDRYGCQWEFCDKQQTGRKILELLGVGQ